ncbi:MAG: PQQ-like beta-propeller repeat protein [Deltaproteobacteria bacterium]|nr:PQQ-like beta-propeller repeat protein [Deltaproteobacteria bacterium]
MTTRPTQPTRRSTPAGRACAAMGPWCAGAAWLAGAAALAGGCDTWTEGVALEPTRPTVPYETGSPWPKFRGNAMQNGRVDVKPSQSGGALWDLPTGKGIFSSPVVGADGTIYVGSADRIFYAIHPDGSIKWQVLTGEIIDSSALLDDQGRVYFGSGDGKLRALDAQTGDEVWTYEADDPSVNEAFINWFEGNVAMGPSGTLYVPNDNFFLYAINRDDGSVKWRFKMPDQTWSLPAIDTRTETLYVGNNNVLPLLGSNTFAINSEGEAEWSLKSLGTIAASPMLTADDKMIVGGYDGTVRAYLTDGELLWETATRDHVYASPGELPDGTIVQPSADGTIYGLRPADGVVLWAFDTREPIRSSPAIDGDGNIYVGSGEGRLFVLNPDGTLRWAMQLIEEARNDLNGSPALGQNGVYIAGESGQIFSVPYEYCLRPEGLADDRCSQGPGEDLPDDGVHLLYTTNLGALTEMPETIDPNQALTFSLLVRKGGDNVLAIIDSDAIEVTVDPPTHVTIDVAGDGRFLTLTPIDPWGGGSGGTLQIAFAGDYLVDMERHGLALSGGTKGGDIDLSFETTVRPGDALAMPLPVAAEPGDPAGVWELSRLAIPTPTMMPSYNQIGFDSLHYLIGLVELDGGKGVAWMVGAKLAEDENATIIDPATKAILPLTVAYEEGVLTMLNNDGLTVEVMNAIIPFRTFRIGARLDESGQAVELATMSGSTICAEVPFYGPFLQILGLCNPQTDVLSVFGGAILDTWQGGTQQAPSGLGTVAFSGGTDKIVATVTDSTLALDEHVFTLLLIDDATGQPITLDYGLETIRTAHGDGSIATVTIPTTGVTMPAAVRAYLMVDTYPAARAVLTP